MFCIANYNFFLVISVCPLHGEGLVLSQISSYPSSQTLYISCIYSLVALNGYLAIDSYIQIILQNFQAN